ncbi:MAG: hypothetical protein UH625_09900 [Muribaculaceae bacterium]|nr:hypothetical protein [Muribaculaceae bacterium]
MEKEKKISTKDMVVNVLKEDPFFKDFKYNRTYGMLIKYTVWGHFALVIESRMYVPGISEFRFAAQVHYRVITDWFSKYSYYERDGILLYWNVSEMINIDDDYGRPDVRYGTLVRRDPEYFAKDVEKMKREIIIQADRVFKKFDNLDNYYEYEVKPLIEGKRELYDCGGLMSTTLATTKIVAPENYEKLKRMFYEDWKSRPDRGYQLVDALHYLPILDEIYAYLDSINLKDQVIKRRGEKEITDAVFARKPKESEGKFSWLLSFANKLKN